MFTAGRHGTIYSIIYVVDGSFSGIKKKGCGVTAALLMQAGIMVRSERCFAGGDTVMPVLAVAFVLLGVYLCVSLAIVLNQLSKSLHKLDKALDIWLHQNGQGY